MDHAQRASSTKTRIKTNVRIFMVFVFNNLREHHPLKQGLRPSCVGIQPACKVLREHHPLKQGLRPCDTFVERKKNNISESISRTLSGH